MTPAIAGEVAVSKRRPREEGGIVMMCSRKALIIKKSDKPILYHIDKLFNNNIAMYKFEMCAIY